MRKLAIALALLAVAGIAACGSDSEDDSGGAKVVATTGILADISERIAGGDAEVEQLIPEGASPHDFELSAQDRAGAEDADLLVANGAGLEAGVPTDDLGVPTFELAENAGPLLPAGEETHAEGEEHTEEDEHEEDGGDPHVWMDPTRTAAALPALADAFAEADPEHADLYRSRAKALANELTALDGEIERELATIPAGSRELVTSHDALGYFADRYGFDVVATAFPATGAEAEASAGKVNEVAEAIRSAGVPAVFAEHEDDPEVLELVADETGVEVVTDLLVESPGDSGGYIQMLQRDADLIAGALTGGGNTP